MPIHRMNGTWSRFSCWSAALVFLLCLAKSTLFASINWVTTEQELAKRIVAITGAAPLKIDVTNRSSLSEREASDFARGLQTELARLGVQSSRPDNATTVVHLTLSQNLTSYLAVAEIRHSATAPKIAIVSIPMGESSNLGADSPPIVLRKTPIWSQSTAVLDAALFDDATGASHLVVLDAANVSIYRFVSGRWQRDQALLIQHAAPWPRDLRGRLLIRSERQFGAFLPGYACAGLQTSIWSLECHPSDDPWPLNPEAALRAFFAPTRNFFTGVLSPGVGNLSSTAKFYSAASMAHSNYMLWIFTAVDGTVHLLDGTTEQIAYWKWGSDIASVKTSCGSGSQMLVTEPGTDGHDAIRAYEVLDRDPTPVSPAADFPGTITALWTEAKGASAIATSRNLRTGDYEVIRLTLTCGQ